MASIDDTDDGTNQSAPAHDGAESSPTNHRQGSAPPQRVRENGTSEIPADLATIRRTGKIMNEHVNRLLPGLWDAFSAACAVLATGGIIDNGLPVALFLTGAPSSGKSAILRLLMPVDEQDTLSAYLYRSDNFTAASFVSHRADCAPDKLTKEIDLLPQIQDKALITKELSPLLRGRSEDLVKTFSVLASVLDGEGLTTNTGAHGKRGYVGQFLFRWLGATTPLTSQSMELMGQVGPRIYMYATDRSRKTNEQLAEFVQGTAAQINDEKCRCTVHDYLEVLLPARRQLSDFTLSSPQACVVAAWAEALTGLRAPIERVTEGSDAESEATVYREQPERAVQVLRAIAFGGALSRGRTNVTDYELLQIGHIALSSGVRGRSAVFAALLDLGGHATTPQVVQCTQMSDKTVMRHMNDLAAVGLVRFHSATSGGAARIELIPDLDALIDAPRFSKAP